jgi:hypothetical protein
MAAGSEKRGKGYCGTYTQGSPSTPLPPLGAEIGFAPRRDWPRSIVIWHEFRKRSLDDKAALEQFATYWSEYKMAGHEREWMRVSGEGADGG